MSVAVSESDITAFALGNPIVSRVLRKDTHLEEGDVVLENFEQLTRGFASQPESGYTAFIYRVDHERYESGSHVTVSYLWNEDEVECFENDLLGTGDWISIKIFREQILPKIEKLRPVTLIRIKTVKGSLVISELPRDIPKDKEYPHIPDTLSASIPSVPITSLRRCKMTTWYQHIGIVTIQGDTSGIWYVFKTYQIPIERQKISMDDLLSEAELLNRINSPYIIKPCFLVTDDSMSLFRGYLMPLIPAGTLQDIFLTTSTEEFIVHEPMVLHPKFIKPFIHPATNEEWEREKAVGEPIAPNIPWSIKLAWAIEAASAIVVLHANELYSGDIKLTNILLARDGHIRLIDVAPQDGYSDGYMAPEYDPRTWPPPYPLTEARDIYAFGIVLWQIAEEVRKMMEWDERFDIVWRSNVQGTTPQWYQDLVARCIATDPTERPSARDILAVLGSNR